jgi:sortase (surface protein transpeptidase)
VFIGAVFIFGYCALVLVDAWMFQWRLARELERCIRAAETPNERPVRMSCGSKTSATGLIGRMAIMRASVSAVVIEGSDAALRRGVGHIPGTSLPVRGRNVRIAGHRDTFFRPPRNVYQGDMITFTTLLE